MINKSVQIGFSDSQAYSTSTVWATIEQEYQADTDNDEASLADLYSMLALGKAGTSSLEYLIRDCSYVTMTEEEVVVTLNLYVWPHDMSMNYDIVCTEGVMSASTKESLKKSFDIIIDNESHEILPYVFNGEALPTTPFISEYGEILDTETPTIEGSLVSISKDAFVVLRLDGEAVGYKHSVTLTYPMATIISEDFKVNQAENVVTLSYTDEDGELQAINETLDIPPCVTQILEFCGAHLYWAISAGLAGAGNTIEIYTDECKGGVLIIREVDEDGKTVGYPYV